MTGHSSITLAPTPKRDLALEERIAQEQAVSLLGLTKAHPVSASFAGLVFWVSFYIQTPQPGILVWAALLHGTQLHRFYQAKVYDLMPVPERNIPLLIKQYTVAHGISGMVWGLAPWLFLPKGDIALTSLVVLMLLCMSSVSMMALSNNRQALAFFNYPLALSLAASLFWQRDFWGLFIGIAVLIYVQSSVRYGFKQHQLLADSLRARYENEALAKDLEAQVRKVEQASQEKTRFFASASHDLRQPLHSLGLFGSAIQAHLKNTPQEPLANNLLQCVDALETSFSAMLDLSKLDAGVVVAHPAPVALAQVFRNLANTFGGQAESRGLSLRFRPGTKWAETDPALLERLLGNLIQNALKFTHSGGVTVVARGNDKRLRVEVWDTGCGIAEPELSRIFDEFYQVGNQERDRTLGLGMGLAIVKRLAILLETSVVVGSKVGKGSVFKIQLAQTSQREALPSFGARAISSGVFRALTGLRVLVIDDEASVRNSTSAALRLYGLQVEVADGLASARELVLALDGGIDALITDYRLCKGDDGIEVSNHLNALLGRNIPTLLITGDTAPHRVRQAEVSGLRVLYKPVRISQMVEALRTQISASTNRPVI